MTALLLGAATLLLLTMAVALTLIRAEKGEPLLMALLLGTCGVALCLLLGAALSLPGATDIALTFALLAAILGVAFVRRGWPRRPDASGGDGGQP